MVYDQRDFFCLDINVGQALVGQANSPTVFAFLGGVAVVINLIIWSYRDAPPLAASRRAVSRGKAIVPI